MQLTFSDFQNFNSYFKHLPIDIIEYIISINIKWAINILKYSILNYKNKLLKNNINEIYNLITFAMVSGIGCTLDNYYIHFKDKIYNKEKLFNKLIKCNCCKRHQTLRPNTFKKWINTEFHFSNNKNKCKCSCRHMARMICRSIH